MQAKRIGGIALYARKPTIWLYKQVVMWGFNFITIPPSISCEDAKPLSYAG